MISFNASPPGFCDSYHKGHKDHTKDTKVLTTNCTNFTNGFNQKTFVSFVQFVVSLFFRLRVLSCELCVLCGYVRERTHGAFSISRASVTLEMRLAVSKRWALE